MKCSHKKALAIYQANKIGWTDEKVRLEVKCNRCKKYVGDKVYDYALPRDMFKPISNR